MAVDNPYEVVSSEDMLSRVCYLNSKIKKIVEDNGEKIHLNKLFIEGAEDTQDYTENEVDYNWESEYILLGTDIKLLFPSLSAKRTGQSVRKQFATKKKNSLEQFRLETGNTLHKKS